MSNSDGRSQKITVEGLTEIERSYLAMQATYEAKTAQDPRYNQHRTSAENEIYAARWQDIADALHPDPWGRNADSHAEPK
jgi:hypothetical protein